MYGARDQFFAHARLTHNQHGGLVVSEGCRLDTMLQCVHALQKWCVEHDLSGLEIRLGPALYLRQPDAKPSA